MNIAVAGTGYVGLSLAVLLSQKNHVTAVDILPEKVDLLRSWKSPIRDDYIEKYLAEKQSELDDYDIFMAIAENIGYDATGKETGINELEEIGAELAKFIQRIVDGE